MVHGRSIKLVGWRIVRMGVGGECFVLEVEVLVFYLVVHVEMIFWNAIFAIATKLAKNGYSAKQNLVFRPQKLT